MPADCVKIFLLTQNVPPSVVPRIKYIKSLILGFLSVTAVPYTAWRHTLALFFLGEAEINDPMEDAGEESESEGGDFEDGFCSECPCFRMVCKGCCHEGGD